MDLLPPASPQPLPVYYSKTFKASAKSKWSPAPMMAKSGEQ